MKRLVIPILILLVSSCGINGELGTSDAELSAFAEKSQPIIDALEQYKVENGEYPEDLLLLSPEYIKEPFNLSYSKSTDDSIGGYRLTAPPVRQFVMLGDREIIQFVFYPSGKYPERKFQKPIKRVRNWALIQFFRTYGAENPIISDGV